MLNGRVSVGRLPIQPAAGATAIPLKSGAIFDGAIPVRVSRP